MYTSSLVPPTHTCGISPLASGAPPWPFVACIGSLAPDRGRAAAISTLAMMTNATLKHGMTIHGHLRRRGNVVDGGVEDGGGHAGGVVDGCIGRTFRGRRDSLRRDSSLSSSPSRATSRVRTGSRADQPVARDGRLSLSTTADLLSRPVVCSVGPSIT